MKKNIFFFISIFFLANLTYGSTYFASPNGSDSNSGTSPNSPFTLDFAVGNSSPISPGDSLILLDGTYGGNFIFSLNGAQNKPIYVISENEGKVIIDVSKNRTSGAGITVDGNHIWIVGIHVTSSSLIRKSDATNGFSPVLYESGIVVLGDNNKIINCWVYDVVGSGMELWRTGLNLEVYGSVIFNNGSQSDSRGTGHGIYIQHDQPNQPKLIENNFVFQNASRGINIYTTYPKNGGVNVRRNTSFNTGVIATFNQSLFGPTHNFVIGSHSNESFEMTVDSNVFYSDLQGGRLNGNLVSNVALGRNDPPTRDIKFNKNILFGGGNMVEFKPINGLNFQGNRLFNVHGNFFDFSGNTSSFPNSTWDLNTYRNIENNPKPFQGLNYSEWIRDFSPFDSGSSYSNSPSTPWEVLITQNKYDSLRFHVSILSFSDSEQIALDFSDYEEFKGAEYEIRDIQNPFDPSQKVKGTFGGNSISFPMNWTKSLQPKGNMPNQAKHTDSTFGTFLLEFKGKNQDLVDFPSLKDSVTLFLNNEGVVSLSPQNFLSEQPNEPYTYFSSKGFDFDCSDLGKNELSIILKNSRTGKEKTVPIIVWIIDNLPPMFDAANATYIFDPVVGKVSLSLDDFDIRNLKDNCAQNFDISLSQNEISCADIYQDPSSPIWEFPLIIEVTDPSGNAFSKTVKAIIGDVIESQKISISPESGTQFLEGQKAEIRLGEEFGFSVLAWYRNGLEIEGQKGKILHTEVAGTYWASLIPEGGGCKVESKKTEIKFTDLPFGEIKENVTLILGPDGKVNLNPENVFENWPLPEPNLEITLDSKTFTCENIGEKTVLILIKNQLGQVWEKTIKVIIKDQTPPVLEPRIISLELDVARGVVEISPEMVLAEFGDNCGLKSLTIDKKDFTCEDIGKEFSVAIRAEDNFGNITEAMAKVSIVRKETEKVIISGLNSFCKGEYGVLELSSSLSFEVVHWRRNGAEIQGQTGEKLEVSQSGIYHAVIRYPGGCLAESQDFEVKVNPLPEGEIKEDGNILRAPEGNFTYQWFRNGEKISGATSQVYAAEMMGEYSVELISPSPDFRAGTPCLKSEYFLY